MPRRRPTWAQGADPIGGAGLDEMPARVRCRREDCRAITLLTTQSTGCVAIPAVHQDADASGQREDARPGDEGRPRGRFVLVPRHNA
jgi:hypothetical protein